MQQPFQNEPEPAESGPPQLELNEREIDQVLQALAPIREVYEPELLQALAKKLPRYVAIQNEALLLEWTADNSCVVGMSEPDNAVNVHNIARALEIPSNKIHARFVAAPRLAMLHEAAYEERDDSVAINKTEAEERQKRESTRETINWQTLDKTASSATKERELAEPEIEIGLGSGLRASAEKIILEAIKRRASDIHVMPGSPFGKIRIRTDGAMSTLISAIPPERMSNLANAFSDMARVNAYELMQEGKGAEINIVVKTTAGAKERMTLRFHGRRGYYGIAIVIRINRPIFRDFNQIGIEPSQQEELMRALEYRNGVILVTGTTGSGKSNTLEAMLRTLETRHHYSKQTIQIGNPIEFPNDERHQLPLDSDEAWGEALNDALRMDPDFFSPGEFRNPKEAAIVFQAAATGHLTLTTLHTNDVASTFSRLDFMEIGRDKQGDLLRLIATQSLIPLNCRHCRKVDPRTREILERLLLVFPNRPDIEQAILSAEGGSPFFHAEGCPACHHLGIKGRTCIAEILHITPDISRMLRKNVDAEDIVNHAVRNHGMMTLAEAAARKLCRGDVSYDHVKHLLIATHEAAPNTETHQWQTHQEEEDPVAASRNNQQETNMEDSDAIIAEYVDVEFNNHVSTETSRASAAGFSLMELLIVCAIITVIAAIGIPSLIASRRAAFESTAKQKLATIGQQETAYKTLLGKRRYGSISELQASISGGSPLLTTSDITVTGWTFSDEGASSTTTFGAKVVPATGNPATYSFFISQDQTLRRCPATGPWNTACAATDQ